MRFRGVVTQAVLIGSARLSGPYTTMDQRSYSPLFPGAPTPPPPTTQVGKIAFVQSSAEVLPVTEVQLYAAVDLGGGISVGLGGFLSIRWNAPVPPTLQVSSTAVDLGAGASPAQPPIGSWSPQRRTLVFPGLGVQLSARF